MLIELEPFHIVGIATRTTNKKGQAGHDMTRLWVKLLEDNIAGKIGHKIGNEIYSVYTEYESNYLGLYTAILGYKVPDLNDVPEGMKGVTVEGGKYRYYLAKGALPDSVLDVWQGIWDEYAKDGRRYTTDFEIYGRRPNTPEDTEVDMYLATTR